MDPHDARPGELIERIRQLERILAYARNVTWAEFADLDLLPAGEEIVLADVRERILDSLTDSPDNPAADGEG